MKKIHLFLLPICILPLLTCYFTMSPEDTYAETVPVKVIPKPAIKVFVSSSATVIQANIENWTKAGYHI